MLYVSYCCHQKRQEPKTPSTRVNVFSEFSLNYSVSEKTLLKVAFKQKWVKNVLTAFRSKLIVRKITIFYQSS